MAAAACGAPTTSATRAHRIRTARSLAIVANWSLVAARRSSIRPIASAVSTPRASRARRYSTAAAIVHPSSWPSDAPASWKRVPSTVTMRSAGRSAPSRRYQRGDGVELLVEPVGAPAECRRTDRIGAERPAARLGVDAVEHREQRVGRLLPAFAGLQSDRRDVEQHAVEGASEGVGVDDGESGDVEQDRRGAPLELADGTSGAGRRIDALAYVPALAVADDGLCAR